MDATELTDRAAPLLDQAWNRAVSLTEPIAPAEGSPLRLLSTVRTSIPPGGWTNDDVKFPVETVRGLMMSQAAHLVGYQRVISDGRECLLHPMMALVRSAAEAGGSVAWLLEPFWPPPGTDATLTDEAWLDAASAVLVRSQVLRLDELAVRRRRHEVETGAALPADEAALAGFKDALLRQHGEAHVRLTGGRGLWHADSEDALPQ